MRILMVSPYPPHRDGIASYAVQEVRRLMEEGHDVEVLSPGPSAAHHHLDLCGWRGAAALAKRVRAYDRVIVQFHPDFFYPHPIEARQRDAITLALIAAWRLREVEVRVHEVNYAWGEETGASGRLFRSLWKVPKRITVHTERERDQLAAAMQLDPSRVEVVDHGSHFAPRTTLDRVAAREQLGLPADERIFVSTGFIQPHKGFDRAVRAFDGLGAHGCRLDIVGSLRVEEPEFVGYLDELRALVRATPGTHLHEGYVSDEAFDLWLVAADAIVLPYRFIWSSGVLERAALYDRPVIASNVGGLAGQAGPGVTLVDDDTELAAALWRAAGVDRSDAPAAVARVREPWPVVAGQPIDRERLQAEVHRRAEAVRGELADHAGPVPAPIAPGVGPLRTVGLAALPATTSRNPAARVAKRVVRKLTAWQMQPLVDHLNTVHVAAAEAVEQVGTPTEGAR